MEEHHERSGNSIEKQFLPWAIIISALIISLALFWNANTISKGVTDLKASVENIKISAPAAGNSGTTAQAQATQQAQQPQKPADLSFASDSKLYPFVGPKDASVTVIEFYDFQCPFCGMAHGIQYSAQYADLIGSEQKVRALAKEGKVKFIFGGLAFLGAESFTSETAALCAHEQGKFVEMFDAIYDNQQSAPENGGKYTNDKLKILAKNITSLDQVAFGTCLDSNKYKATIDTLNQNGFNNAGVKGTPTFYVNGVQSSGSWTELKAKLSAAGVQAQ